MRNHITYIAILFISLITPCLAEVTLDIMVEDAAGDWSRPDGTGYCNDIVKAAYAAVDVPVKLTVVPYVRCKTMVLNGVTTACFNMGWEESTMKGVIKFSKESLYILTAKFYANSTNRKTEKIALLKDITEGSVIGIVRGYEYPDEVLALKQVKFYTLDSEKMALKMLEFGRLDYAIVIVDAIKTVDKIRKENGVGGKVVYAFDGGKLPNYVGFSIKNAQGDYAKTKFDQGYDIIKANGVLKAISHKWKVLN